MVRRVPKLNVGLHQLSSCYEVSHLQQFRRSSEGQIWKFLDCWWCLSINFSFSKYFFNSRYTISELLVRHCSATLRREVLHHQHPSVSLARYSFIASNCQLQALASWHTQPHVLTMVWPPKPTGTSWAMPHRMHNLKEFDYFNPNQKVVGSSPSASSELRCCRSSEACWYLKLIGNGYFGAQTNAKLKWLDYLLFLDAFCSFLLAYFDIYNIINLFICSIILFDFNRFVFQALI